MKILTVSGIKDIKNIQMVDSHVHLWIEKPTTRSDYPIPSVTERTLIENCLKDFKNNGGDVVIDCTPYECGRNGKVLYDISKVTGINILSVSGFHCKEYYPPDSKIWKFDEDKAANFFKKEVEQGLKETLADGFNIKASVIKIPFVGMPKGDYLILTNAAIKIAIEMNVPILVHTEQGKGVEWFSNFLLKSGVKPEKVVFCHVDKRNDILLHQKLAEQGFYLEYDTFLREKYNPDPNTYELISLMVKRGFGSKIMIGSDISENIMWKKIYEGQGYGGFFKGLKNTLESKLENEKEVMNIMGGNAAEFLRIKN